MESVVAAVTKDKLNLKKKILINLEASETEFFAKVNEKCKIVRIFGNKEYKLG